MNYSFRMSVGYISILFALTFGLLNSARAEEASGNSHFDPSFFSDYDSELKEARQHLDDPKLGMCENEALKKVSQVLNRNQHFYKLLYRQAVLKSAAAANQISEKSTTLNSLLAEKQKELSADMVKSTGTDEKSKEKLKADINAVYGRFGYLPDVAASKDIETAQNNIKSGMVGSGELTRGSAFLLAIRHSSLQNEPNFPKIELSDAAIVWATEYSEKFLSKQKSDDSKQQSQFFNDVDESLGDPTEIRAKLEKSSNAVDSRLGEMWSKIEKSLTICFNKNPQTCHGVSVSKAVDQLHDVFNEKVKERFLLDNFLVTEQQIQAKDEVGTKVPRWAVKLFQNKGVRSAVESVANKLTKTKNADAPEASDDNSK